MASVVETEGSQSGVISHNPALGISLMLTVGLVAFEGLSVVAALPELGRDLQALRGLPWVMTGYLLASGLAIALAGPVVDRWGARRIFQSATLAFAASSVVCGASVNVGLLIAARVVQGAAGGAIMATLGAAVGLGYPARLRSRVYAMNATVWGAMAFGGPALAAALLAILDWRWIFYVNTPLALFAAVLGWSAMPGPPVDADPSESSFDLRGTLILATFTVVCLLGLSEVSTASLGVVLAALVLGSLYWWHSGSVEAPVLKRRHFAQQPFRGLGLTAGFVMAAGMGVETFLPLYLRQSRETGTSLAAWSVIFVTLGWTTGANVVSRLYDRISEATCALIAAVCTVPLLAFSAFTVLHSRPLWELFVAYFALGFAIGSATNACLTLVQACAAPQEIGRATASHQFVRNMAVTYGIAASGAILLSVALRRTADLATSSEPARLEDLTGPALASGFAFAHWLAAGLAMIAVACAIRLRRVTEGARHFEI